MGLAQCSDASTDRRRHAACSWPRRLGAAACVLFGIGAASAAPYYYTGSQSDGTIEAIDTATNTVVATFHGESPGLLLVSHDGARLFNFNASLQALDPATGQVLATASTPGSGLPLTNPGGTIDPYGKYVYAIDNALVLDVFGSSDLSAVSIGITPSEGGPFGQVVPALDGKTVYLIGSGAFDVVQPPYDFSSFGTLSKVVWVTGMIHMAALTPDGLDLWVSNPGLGQISDYSTDTDQVVASIADPSGAGSIIFSPDGQRAYVTDLGSNTIAQIDPATGTAIGSPLAIGNAPHAMAVSPDGTRLYVSNGADGTVSVIDTASFSTLATVAVGSPQSAFLGAMGPGALIATTGTTSTLAGLPATAQVGPVSNVSGCAISYVVIRNPVHGMVQMSSASGTYTYTPNAGYSGHDAFLWRAQAQAACAVADAPLLPYSNSAAEYITITPALNGLANITTGEGTAAREAFSLEGTTPMQLAVASSNVALLPASAITMSPGCGQSTATESCSVTMTPAAGQTGLSDVSFTATDPAGLQVSRTVVVSVVPPPTLGGVADVSVITPGPGREVMSVTGSGPLQLTAASDNPTLLADSGISGPAACTTAGSCTLTLNPNGSTTGTALVTLTLADGYGQSTTQRFHFVVQPRPASPTISGLTNLQVTTGQPPGSETLTIGGTGALKVTATSSNPALLPVANVGGLSGCTAAGACSLTLSPAAGQLGQTTVSVTVSDSYGQTATGVFTLTVNAAAGGGTSGGGGGLDTGSLLALLLLCVLDRWRNVVSGRRSRAEDLGDAAC